MNKLDTQSNEAGQLAPSDNGAMSLLAQAVQHNAQPEQIDKLIELVKFHDQREALRAFNQAFTSAQAEFPTIRKTKKAHNSNYAPLSEIAGMLRPVLIKHGLSFRHEVIENDNNTVTVRCILAHAAGHSEAATLTGPSDTSGSKNAIQAIGSSVTYLKRYTLEAVTGVVTTDNDDDGAQLSKVTDQQVSDLESLVSECGFDKAGVLEYYKLNSWAELPAANFDAVCKELRAKYRQRQQKKGAKK